MSEIPSTIEQDISQLEQQLREKRASLGQEKAIEVPTDKELLKSVVGDKIQAQAPAFMPVPSSLGTATPSYATPALQVQVQQLVDLAFSKNLTEAISELIKLNNPALIDAFHDVISDQLHQEMVNRKLIDQP